MHDFSNPLSKLLVRLNTSNEVFSRSIWPRRMPDRMPSGRAAILMRRYEDKHV